MGWLAALEDTPKDLQPVGWQGVVWLSGMVGQLVETYMTCFGKFSSSWLVGWLAALEDNPRDLQSVVSKLSGMVGEFGLTLYDMLLNILFKLVDVLLLATPLKIYIL